MQCTDESTGGPRAATRTATREKETALKGSTVQLYSTVPRVLYSQPILLYFSQCTCVLKPFNVINVPFTYSVKGYTSKFVIIPQYVNCAAGPPQVPKCTAVEGELFLVEFGAEFMTPVIVGYNP